MNKNEYKKSIEAILDQLEEKIDDLKKKVSSVSEDAKKEYNEHIEKLKGLQKDLTEKMGIFEDISQSKWDVVKESSSSFLSKVGVAWDEEVSKIKEAFSKQ